VSAYRVVDLCDSVEQASGVSYSPWLFSCLLKRLNLSRQKTRPSHLTGNPAAPAVFNKGAASDGAHHSG
jgi:transposase